MRRNRNKIIVVLLILLISIGFAFLSSNLSIIGNTLVSKQTWDIHFENVQVNEETLSQAYHTRVANYMEEMKINNQDDLTALVQQGRNYYPVLPEELEARLLPMSEIVSGQMIQNWNAKDPETAQIIATRQQQMSNGGIKL